MKKLGFCFLIYDIINHEELWNQFFKHVDPAKYGIYIHYKTNTPLKFFEKHKLDHCIPTNYADVTLIHAHNILCKAAYDDGCDKIISLSQACIPLKSFHYVYDFLTRDDYGHFNMAPPAACFPRCNELLKFYDRSHIQKSSNWFILNRTICRTVISEPLIQEHYGSIISPEEHFFISTVYKYGLQDQIIATQNIAAGATTFTNWQGMSYPFPSKKELKNYSEISDEEILYLLASKSLFGRKFNRECMGSLCNPTYLKFITSSLVK